MRSRGPQLVFSGKIQKKREKGKDYNFGRRRSTNENRGRESCTRVYFRLLFTILSLKLSLSRPYRGPISQYLLLVLKIYLSSPHPTPSVYDVIRKAL